MFSRGTSYVADVANGPPVLHLLNGGDADAVTMCIPKVLQNDLMLASRLYWTYHLSSKWHNEPSLADSLFLTSALYWDRSSYSHYL